MNAFQLIKKLNSLGIFLFCFVNIIFTADQNIHQKLIPDKGPTSFLSSPTISAGMHWVMPEIRIIQTPEMDKLAESGAYFRNAIVTTPICAASRASIFSGLYERTHKYTFQTGPIREEYMENSYPEVLKEGGILYRIFREIWCELSRKQISFSTWLNPTIETTAFMITAGYYYKTLNGDTVHLTRYTGEKALEFIDNAPTDKPFCLSLSFSAPHAHDPAPLQYFWQEEPGKLYQNMEMPPAKTGRR